MANTSSKTGALIGIGAAVAVAVIGGIIALALLVLLGMLYYIFRPVPKMKAKGRGDAE